VDDFHNVSAVRYRRGRSSPGGVSLDSFNYERLRADELEPRYLLAPVLLSPTCYADACRVSSPRLDRLRFGVLRPIHPACRTDLTTKKVLSLQGRVLLTLL
jgi:hypothetical protein